MSTIFNDAHHRKESWKILSNTLQLEEYQWNLVIWGIRPMTSMDTRTEFYGKSDSMLFHILRGLDVTRVTQRERSSGHGIFVRLLNKRDALMFDLDLDLACIWYLLNDCYINFVSWTVVILISFPESIVNSIIFNIPLLETISFIPRTPSKFNSHYLHHAFKLTKLPIKRASGTG